MQMGFKEAMTGERWFADPIHPDNDYLCAVYIDNGYYIYNVATGKPYLKIKFATKELAIQLGKMLHEWYGEYFDILKVPQWRDVDIPGLFQWTIPNGVEIYTALEELKSREVVYDLNQFSRFT